MERADLAPPGWLCTRCVSCGDKRLRSQPRRLYRGGAERPDAFRKRRHRSFAGQDCNGPGKSPPSWRMIMMHSLKPVRSKLPRLAILLAGVACLGLAGCDDNAGDPKVQIGANPVLPALQQYLMPPMAVAKVAGWGKETPTVAEGLQVHALATGFAHPR